MAEDVVIRAEGLGKKYVIGHAAERERYVALRDVMARGGKQLMAQDGRHGARPRHRRAATRSRSSGRSRTSASRSSAARWSASSAATAPARSTLLKILSRITEPTEGRVAINGRVASLLEVGTGFHPELTGRENIYLNGAILGMTRAEIRRKFDEIVAFAEVEKFLDTPVKRYSTGMYVRLAFAVAAHLEPEILIVDEVLAVGDAEFQKKCLGKMDEVSRRDGRTVLFVSHNMGVVTSLCPMAIWLDGGSIRERGAAREVISEYLSRGELERQRIVRLAHLPRSEWAEDGRLRLESVEWLSDLPLRHGERVRARIRFNTRAPVLGVAVGIGFSNVEGGRLLTYETDFQDGYRPDVLCPGKHSVEITIDNLPLAPDIYSLDVGCRSGDSHGLDYVAACSRVEVIAGPTTPGYIVRKGAGARLPSQWSWDLSRQESELQLVR